MIGSHVVDLILTHASIQNLQSALVPVIFGTALSDVDQASSEILRNQPQASLKKPFARPLFGQKVI